MAYRLVEDQDTLARAKICLQEVQAVLKKHGFALGHEDSQGSFELEPVDTMYEGTVVAYTNWLNDATVIVKG